METDIRLNIDCHYVSSDSYLCGWPQEKKGPFCLRHRPPIALTSRFMSYTLSKTDHYILQSPPMSQHTAGSGLQLTAPGYHSGKHLHRGGGGEQEVVRHKLGVAAGFLSNPCNLHITCHFPP